MDLLIVASISMGWVLVLTLCIFGLGELIKWQARKPTKRFFAPIPRPGSFSFVVLEGKVINIIENVVGWSLRAIPTLKNAQCFTLEEKEEAGLLETYLGVRWIGLFATIKVFPKWMWSEFRQITEEESGVGIPKYQIVARKEDVSDFFLQFPYPVTLENAEIKSNIRVKIDAVFTVLHFHPVRAFFLNKDPVALFNAMVQSALRGYVIDKDFDTLKGIKASATGEDSQEKTFWEILEELNGITMQDDGSPDYDSVKPLGLFGKLGYIIVRGEVLQVEPFGEAANALEAARLAELQGQALVETAKKEAEALKVKTGARRRWVKETIVNPIGGPGPQVANVLEAEEVASKDSSVTTWVKGGGAIVAVPSGESKK